MRNDPFLFWLLLFADGVFGADVLKSVSVSVMVGDSVTLHTDDTETQGALELEWKIQGENKFIAEIDKEMNTNKVPGNDEERFRGRLKLDDQTGSLTITNLNTTDSRVYELHIKNSKETKSYIFNVAVSDIVKSVSVMEGDSVTLHTNVANIQRDDQILWKFGDQGTIIARLTFNGLNGATDSRWSNIHLNDQTGELTIRNIRKDQSGDYEVEINTSTVILHRKFVITFDEMKTVSLKEGEPVSLHTGLIEIKGYDLILWTFENHLIARINRTTNQFSLFSAEGKFEGRLQREHQTGSLIIRDSRTTDSGDYHLNMSSSAYTLQRTISVTVKIVVTDSGLSPGVIAGVCVAVAVAVVLILIVLCCYNKRKKHYDPAGQGNGTQT